MVVRWDLSAGWRVEKKAAYLAFLLVGSMGLKGLK